MSDAPQTLADICDDAVYTPKQIAKALGTSSRRVIKAFDEDLLAGVELGPRTYRFTGRSVREWVEYEKFKDPDACLGTPWRNRKVIPIEEALKMLSSGDQRSAAIVKRRRGNWVDRLPDDYTKNTMQGLVYFVDCLDCTKIGFTSKPIHERMETWLTGNPFDLHIFALMPGAPADERELHVRFKMMRFRREWFRFTAGDKQQIVSIVTERGGVILEQTIKTYGVFA
jgi:hypothetical protein